MLAYKLLRLRKNGTLGPLFINKSQVIPVGEDLAAQNHPTKGYAVRKGWHCLAAPVAPHLSQKGRVWAVVMISDYVKYERPKNQGGLWYLAQHMKVIKVI